MAKQKAASKLSKDQKQKIFLGIIMLGVVAYGLWVALIEPQYKTIEANSKNYTKVAAEIKAAKNELRMSENIRVETEKLNAIYDSALRDIPKGAPIAWFPPRVSKFFTNLGVPEMVTERGTSITPTQPGLSKFEELEWTFTTKKAPFVKFGTALAAFENSEPLIQILSVEIIAGVDDEAVQEITMKSKMLLPKEDAVAPAPAP